MTPYCQQSNINEDEIAEREFGSLEEIQAAFFGDNDVSLCSQYSEIMEACKGIACRQHVLCGFRRPRVNRRAVKKELTTKFGVSGLMLIYYVVCVIWFWRQLRRGG